MLEITGTISESISTVTRYEDSNDMVQQAIADGVSPCTFNFVQSNGSLYSYIINHTILQ